MSASAVHDIRQLVLSFHSLVVVETVEEKRLEEILAQVADDIGVSLFSWTITNGLCKYPSERSVFANTVDPELALKHIEALTVEGIFLLKDLGKLLDKANVARLLREAVQTAGTNRSTMVICGGQIELPRELDAAAAYYRLATPSREELDQVLRSVCNALRQTHPFEVNLTAETESNLIEALAGLTLNQARQAVARAIIEDGCLNEEDIAKIRNQKAEAIRDGGLLEYFPAESLPHEVGGFARLREWLGRASMGFTQQARDLGLEPPRGLMIVGVQGCGKSLAAKAIAKGWQMPLLKLDSSRLYDKYIGESEKNLRRATDLAESLAPAVLWIDEIEKAFASGGPEGGSDGGTSRRVLGSFLTWLQEKPPGVFVVATANDLFVLPPEMLRKGRFDEIFFVDLPNAEARGQIFGIHLRARRQDPAAYDVLALVEASEGFSGSEIEQAIISGLYRALHAGVPPATEQILEEIHGTVPLSVSRREDIARLRAEAQTRFVPVD